MFDFLSYLPMTLTTAGSKPSILDSDVVRDQVVHPAPFMRWVTSGALIFDML